MDEEGNGHGPILVHEMRNSSVPLVRGDRQRRLCKIVEQDGERFLQLSVVEPLKVGGEDGEHPLRWRWLSENHDWREPADSKQ